MPRLCPRDPAPPDGRLPTAALAESAGRRSACTSTCRSARCAAATATSTPTRRSSSGRAGCLAGDVRRRRRSSEVRLARRVLGDRDLPVRHGVLRRRDADPAAARRPRRRARRGSATEFGLAADAEVTTESNPDSVDAADLAALASRRHQPDLVRHAVGGTACAARSSTAPTTPRACRTVGRWARAAGFEQVSLDLIYGTPGETLDDWQRSVDGGARAGPRPRERLRADRRGGYGAGARIAAARSPMPDDDDLADKYELADELLAARGLQLVRGVATGPATAARGAGTTSATGAAPTGGASGPGAHSHVGGVRWWNVKHPAAYADRIAARRSPADGPRGARRRDAAGRAGAARDAAARLGSRCGSLDAAGRGRRTRRW